MSGKLIVCEGIDGTGKTRLAKAIAATIDGVYIHASGRKDIMRCMYQYHEEILNTAEANMQLGKHVILDRHWPSECCYAGILRPHHTHQDDNIFGNSGYYYYSVKKMAEKMHVLAPHFILCDNHKAIQTHAETHAENDHCYKNEQLAMIRCEYLYLFADLKKQYPFKFYNLNSNGMDIADYIIGLIKDWSI